MFSIHLTYVTMFAPFALSRTRSLVTFRFKSVVRSVRCRCRCKCHSVAKPVRYVTLSLSLRLTSCVGRDAAVGRARRELAMTLLYTAGKLCRYAD